MIYPTNLTKFRSGIHAVVFGSIITTSAILPVAAEDAYEENDNIGAPYTGTVVNDPLSAIAGAGEQFDEDWYSLNLPVLGKEVTVEIEWLDGRVFEWLDVYENGSITEFNISGDGTVTFTPAETSMVKVWDAGSTYAGDGRRYDFRYYYTDEDHYEEPNLSDDRYNAGYRPTKGLSLLYDQGPGKLYDSDDFRLDIPSGEDQLVIDCRFSHALGDVNLILLNPVGAVELKRAASVTDNERIVYDLPPEGGRYHIIVYSSTLYNGQPYDLEWTTASPVNTVSPLNTALETKCKQLKKKIKKAKKKGQKQKAKKLKKALKKCLAAMR